MDELTIAHVTLVNHLVKGVELHNALAEKIETLHQAKQDAWVETLPNLPSIGQDFKQIQDTYKEIRDLTIVYEYLAGHDFFTLMNDFKVTRPTLLKLLKDRGVTIRPA